MSTKTFCDRCEDEITQKNIVHASGLITELTISNKPNLNVLVLVGNASDNRRGDFCKYCVLDAVSSLDDRPISID